MAAITTINAGDTLVASRGVINTNFTNLNTELLTAIHRDGSVAFTANQAMGGFKLTGLAAGSAAGNSVRYEQVLLLDGTNAMVADLDMNANDILDVNSMLDTNSNELMTFSVVAASVNQLQIRNAATGNPPAILAQGDNDNIDINLVPKGTGVLKENAVQVMNWNYHAIGARAYLAANQENLVNATWTKILLDTEDYDLGSDFGTNKFTCDVAGYYDITGKVVLLTASVVADKRYDAAIYINGAGVTRDYSHSSLASALTITTFKRAHLAVNDYVELYAMSNAGVDTVDVTGGITATSLEVFLVKRD